MNVLFLDLGWSLTDYYMYHIASMCWHYQIAIIPKRLYI